MMKHAIIFMICICFTGVVLSQKILVLNLDTDYYDYHQPNPRSSTDNFKAHLDELGAEYDEDFVAWDDHTTLTSAVYYQKYDLVFIGVGVNCVLQVSHRFTQAEGQTLVNYLNSGGMVYMEGGDVWYQDPNYNGMFDFQNAFKVRSYAEVSIAGDLRDIEGKSFASGLEFGYDGDNCAIDVIKRRQGLSNTLFENTNEWSEVSSVAVAYDSPLYKTIACSFEFNGLVDSGGVNTKRHLFDLYLEFFGIHIIRYGDVNDDGLVNVLDLILIASFLSDNLSAQQINMNNADVDDSGTVDLRDRVILHNYLVDNITSLPFTG